MQNDDNLDDQFEVTVQRSRKHLPIAVFSVISVHLVLFLGILLSGGCKKSTEAQRSPGEQMAWKELIENAKAGETTTVTEAPNEAGEGASVRTLGYQPASEAGDRSIITASGPGSKLTPTRPDPSPTPSPRAQSGAPMAKQSPAGAATGTPASGAVHTVRKGDSLFKIAKQYGTTPEAVKRSNNLSSDVIHPGQKLSIPGSVKS